MNAVTLLERLRTAGILTPERRAELVEHKPELLEALRRASPLAEAAREIAPRLSHSS